MSFSDFFSRSTQPRRGGLVQGMQAFRQSQGKTSADDFNNLSIPKPHGMGDQPSSKQNDLKDDPDEVLKGLMVHPDYHAEGETGDRLRKAVTDGFKLA